MKNQKYSALVLTLLLTVGCGGGSGNRNNSNSPQNPFGLGPAGVSLAASGMSDTNLGSAGAYVILAKTGVSNTGSSAINGNVGVSPAAESYITGFTLTGAGDHSTSPFVTGNVYAADQAVPTPTNLTSAIGSMENSYENAKNRSNPDYNELSSGDIGGLTLEPGLYKWTSSVTMPMNVTLSGSPTDVWIFQIAGNMSMASGVSILMAGGALPENVYWQVAGQVDLFASSHFEGIILCKTAVNFQTSATINGRVFSQTEVTLQDNDVDQPL